VLNVMDRPSLKQTLGRERMHFNLEIAVQKYSSATEKNMVGARD
jgi:hypothetical protein